MAKFRVFLDNGIGSSLVEADYFEVEGYVLTLYQTNIGKVAAFSSWASVERTDKDGPEWNTI